MGNPTHILVIRLGAIGDIFFTLAALQTIRHQYPKAFIVFFTRKPYHHIIKPLGLFDQIISYPFPRLGRLGCRLFDQWALWKFLRKSHFDVIYDFHNIRSRMLFSPRSKKTLWHVIDPYQNRLQEHPNQSIARQMAELGMGCKLLPDMSWLKDEPLFEDLPDSFACFILGATFWRKNKIWPLENFIAVAQWLIDKKNITPILLGGKTEIAKAKEICALCPEAINLTGKTTIIQAVFLSKKAKFILGHDTGLTHLMVFAGLQSFILIREKIFIGLRHLSLDHLLFFSAKRVDEIKSDRVIEKLAEFLKQEEMSDRKNIND